MEDMVYLKKKCNRLIENSLEKEEELQKLLSTIKQLEEEKNCLENRLLDKEESVTSENIVTEPVTEQRELKRTVNKILVGITGAQPRIGCTHLSIVLANYLRGRGYMVALLEYAAEPEGAGHGTERRVFGQIREAYSEALVENRYFVLNGVDYYADVGSQELQHILSSKFYNFLIVDFGLYQECDQLVYSKCDIRMLVSGAKPWETMHIGQVFRAAEPEALQQIHYVFNFTAVPDRADIRREMAGLNRIFFLPLSENPFTTKDIGDMEKIFAFYGQQEPGAKEKKKHPFLGFMGRR